ncbi:hypothetical protein [Actinophytocola sp.]|uniref:hypothetical protein n=1 Tax=Actinophytocola sp. TaxID=1872138 RepID=UPI003D6C4698
MTANSAGALVEPTAADQGGVEVPAPPAEQPDGQNGQQPPEQSNEAPPPAGSEEEASETQPEPDAPAAPTFPAEAMYAGDATGSDLAIAVAVKGEQASAYLCDGESVESWLKGTAVDGKMDLTSRDGSSRLVAGLDGERLAGEVTYLGQTQPFSIALAPPPAGLYRGENGETTIGWIIMPNGQQVGISNTSGQAQPAPPLDPDEGGVTMDGQRIDAEQVDGDTTFK